MACIRLEAAGVGYALSGGGARGYAQIGILKVLEEEGIYPSYICGTSIGALVGACYALGYSAKELEDLLLALKINDLLDDRFQRREIYIGQKRWPEYGNLNLDIGRDWLPRLPASLYIGNRLNLELARISLAAASYPDYRDFPIPFSCVATDLVSGEGVVFSSGPLMQALRASISVPSVMAPFAFDGRTYIDGGVAQNFPVREVRQLGADVVLGLKVNSHLNSAQELDNVVEIINQTVNIGMTRNINAHLDLCELLLEPDLSQFSNTDFHRAAEIIAAGELHARQLLPEIRLWRDSLLAAGYSFTRPRKATPPDRFLVSSIEVRGNEFVSSAKVREYAALEAGHHYTARQIESACLRIWNSQNFRTAYPVLRPRGEGYVLQFYLQENSRRHLTLNLAYSSEEKLNVSSALILNNILLKNSSLRAGLTLGGRTELNLDYVKNFGEFWGAYFRLYPWLSESFFYVYDAQSYYRLARTRALEYGATIGLGGFANQLAVGEAFAYTARKNLYRDVSVSAPIDSLFLISGVGAKLYHESLDEDVFPSSGIRAFAKLNLARWSKTSDQIVSRLTGSADVYSKLTDFLSLRLGLSFGTFFGAEGVYDPLYFTGSRGYRGYPQFALGAPDYRYYTLALVLRSPNAYHLELGAQGLNAESGGAWNLDQEIRWCAYAELGYRSLVGPLKVSVAVRENARPILSLNIGYDTDFFWFSRK